MMTSTMRLAAAALLVLAACRSAPASDQAAGRLTWTRGALPVPELSGLALAAGPDGPVLYAVGDEEAVLVRVPWRVPLDPRAIARIALPLPTAGGGSQLEAVAVDGKGVVYVLDEARARVHALTLADGRAELRHTFTLDLPRDHPLHARWAAKANKRGEGLVILPGGHLLVAKQADPIALIEFGPAGDTAAGVAQDREPATPTLPAGASSILVPLATWTADAKAAALMESLNDLTRASDGALYAASSKPGPAFARVSLPLAPAGGTFALGAHHDVGDAPAGKAEALAIAPPAETAVIGFDAKGGGANLLVSTPLP